MESEDSLADFEFFRQQLDTVPSCVYFDDATLDIIKRKRSKDVNSGSGDELYDNESVKKKKHKVGSLHHKTVSEIQEEVFKAIKQEDKHEPYSKIKEKKKHKQGKQKNKKRGKEQKKPEGNKSLELTVRQQELRDKLRARIEELQAKSKRLSVDEQKEKKRLKRRENKLKLKGKRKSEKQNKNKEKLENNKSDELLNGLVEKVPVSIKTSKPVLNKEGKLVFSKFDFSDSSKKKTTHSDLTGKDYKRLLKKIENRKQKIDKLKEKDVDLARKADEKNTWKTAILKAEGEKIKDDPNLLKKSIKRKDKLKEKKQEKWKERDSHVEQRMKQKQEKREKNIQARKQAKVDKKIKNAKKKGRMLPGF